MVSIPLAVHAYERTASLLPEVVCRNIFVEKDETDPANPQVVRLQRPGLSLHVSLPAIVRGIFYSKDVVDNRIYAASGSNLVALDASAEGYTVIGDIGNDGLPVTFAPSFDKIAMASGGKLYTYFRSADVGVPPALGMIAVPDDREVIAVADMNSYIIVACPDGRFFWMEPGENEIDLLNFATAESSTDGLVAVQRVNDELYFFGTSSTEIWAVTGDADQPFIRAQGRNFSRGLLDRDTVRLLDNTVFWVAENGVVYRAGNIPARVSTHSIEERISQRTGILSALTITIDAHEFYVLKIPGQGSFAYDAATKMWSEFTTFGDIVWRPGYAEMVGTTGYLADSTSGKVWLFDRNAYTDDGITIERVITGSIPLPATPTRNDNLRMDVGSSARCGYKIRWKDAQGSWTKPVVLYANAGNDRVSLYRLGQAKGQYRTFEITVTDPVQVRIGEANTNDTWQR